MFERVTEEIIVETRDWVQPESCRAGANYYLKIKENGSAASYRPVEFLAYRPCAAEVLVRDGGRPRVICRIDLYQKGNTAGNGT